MSRENGKPRKQRKLMDDEEFVRAWQAAGTRESFVEATGMGFAAGNARANKLRKLGVPLRRFPSARTVRTAEDIKRLKALAEAVGAARQTRLALRA